MKRLHRSRTRAAVSILAAMTALPVIFFAVPNPAAALAQEAIESFDAAYVINDDSSVRVTESIQYNFGETEKHGIYRDIPIRYATSQGNTSISVDAVIVTDAKGVGYQTKITPEGDALQIRIGDPDMLVKGVHEYIISYRVKRAVSYFTDHDEFYWNVTGNGWDIPIQSAAASVTMPRTLESHTVTLDCYAGYVGDRDSCAASTGSLDYADLVKTAYFKKDMLAAGQGMTIVVSFPKGVVTEPGAVAKAIQAVSDNWIMFSPLIAALAMFIIWRKRGRDPKGKGVIIAQYDPPDNLSPLEVGALIDEQVDNRDFSAELIDLAIRGYIRVIREPSEKNPAKGTYIFQKLKDPGEGLRPHQADLLKALWRYEKEMNYQGETITGVAIDDLKEKFYNEYATIKTAIFSSLRDRGYFTTHPYNTRAAYVGVGILIIVLGIFFGQGYGMYSVFSVVGSGLIIGVVGWFMPKRSYQGVLAREHALGLREYITVAEADRIRFHNAPEKSPALFEKLLPFAMVFGAEKAWVAEFATMYTQEPQWYRDALAPRFLPSVFAQSLKDFSTSATTALATAPSGGSGRGGGGSSGGGFGGGGGGSW